MPSHHGSLRVAGAAAGLLLLTAAAGRAEICGADAVPAATLLLPYFEVDPDDPEGPTTLFAVNNAEAAAALAHVTLWTDYAVPTLTFDIYLTGYDAQTINLRDVFNGVLPRTASAAQDPTDSFSNKGQLSEDTTFAGCQALPPARPALDEAARLDLRRAHRGLSSAAYGGCVGANHGDNLVRGYVTVDVVTRCTTLTPASPGYFSEGIAGDRNVLWGWFIYVTPRDDFAQGETLVHVESCGDPDLAAAGGRCPLAASAASFYGRYAAVAGKDQREPLATTYAAYYFEGGAFDGGTELVVWRDTKALAGGAPSCTQFPSWYGLMEADVVAFDEEENVVDLCFVGDHTLPIAPLTGCFPLPAQRVKVGGGNIFGLDPTPPFHFGWLYLNLNHGHSSGAPTPAQAWVAVLKSAEGRYAIGLDAVALDRACEASDWGKFLVP